MAREIGGGLVELLLNIVQYFAGDHMGIMVVVLVPNGFPVVFSLLQVEGKHRYA